MLSSASDKLTQSLVKNHEFKDEERKTYCYEIRQGLIMLWDLIATLPIAFCVAYLGEVVCLQLSCHEAIIMYVITNTF